MDLSLKGRRALITGGTKGIGRAIADIFANEGAAVSICARNAAEVDQTVRELASKGVTAFGQAVDVANRTALRAWVHASAQALGGIDILVPNVSALSIARDEASWEAGFNTDLMGTVVAVDAAMPWLQKSTDASIVIISSVSGREIDFAAGPYGAFKAALIHYAQGLANQHAAQPIRVNTVSPGNTYFPGGIWQRVERDNPDLFARSLALNPTGRMATAEEVGRAVVFLGSPAASFITGTNLVVDGALTRGVQL